MQERTHTSKQYEQQLRVLKEKLLLIGHKAEVAIADSTRALIERRPTLAQRVVDEDDQLDQLEIEIDDICFELLAREHYQPLPALNFYCAESGESRRSCRKHRGNGDFSRRREGCPPQASGKGRRISPKVGSTIRPLRA